MISNSRINVNKETSDSSETNIAFDSTGKRDERYDIEKFKGVVPQQNGHWGAQIYIKHQRIWLGTFKSERDAAMAYDSATIKLRSVESHRNFPWNDQTVQEPLFQSHYSAETVLSMIRDGTYLSKFASFLSTTQNQTKGSQEGNNGIITSATSMNIRVMGSEEQHFCCTQLFQKELTPSDVGKLNRLVIPKKHAVTYFPYVCGSSAAETNDIDMDGNVDLEIVFYDKLMRLWKFRYCYWKSSQSYVFTRGWNRFVKDKKLKAKDIIAFYVCEPLSWRKRPAGEGEAFSLIDVIYNAEDEKEGQCLEDDVRNKLTCSSEIKIIEHEDEKVQESKDINDLGALLHNKNAQKGLKLFGVCIN